MDSLPDSARTSSAATSSAGAPAPGMASVPVLLVTGATGFVGGALLRALAGSPYPILALTRDGARASRLLGDRVRVVEQLDDLPADIRIDAIVHLAGARVLGQPWTAARRRVLLDSRIGIARALVALAGRLRQPPRVLVAASAVGFYGAPPVGAATVQDESAPPRPGEFQSDLCRAIEQEAQRGEALGMRVVRLRFGVVLGRSGGAWPMLARPARLGLGAVLGDGAQPAPWLHLDDAVGILRFALDTDTLQGPVNAVAPDVPTQARFTQALAASFGRGVWLRVPAAMLRLSMGEMATLLLDGQRAAPRALEASGYAFRVARLEDALGELAHP